MSLQIFDVDKKTWIDIYPFYKNHKKLKNIFIGLFGKGLRKINKISDEFHIINFNNFKRGGIKNYIDLCYEPHIYKNLFIPIDNNYCLIDGEEKTIYDIKKENMFRIKLSNNNVYLSLHCNNDLIKNKIKEKDKELIKVLSSYDLLLYMFTKQNSVFKLSYSLFKIVKEDINIDIKNFVFTENGNYYFYFTFYLFQNNYVDIDILKELNLLYNLDVSFQIRFLNKVE